MWGRRLSLWGRGCDMRRCSLDRRFIMWGRRLSYRAFLCSKAPHAWSWQGRHTKHSVPARDMGSFNDRFKAEADERSSTSISAEKGL